MKRPGKNSSLITLVIVIGIIVVLVGSLSTRGPDPAQFSATITGDISRTLSFEMQGDNITLASGTRPSVGEFQLLGLTSQSSHVIVTLGYAGTDMPQSGTYPIRGEPADNTFFGGVLEFSKADDPSSSPDALLADSNTVQYAATTGTISFATSGDGYKGHFNFTAKSPTAQNPIQIEATFSNVRKSESQ